MAQELGLGVTPWGPLRGGALSGKYKRADKGKHEAGRGARVTNYLDDRTFDLLDLMEKIAKELGTTVPRVALSWVQSRPGVTSTIIGARTMEQLDDNVGALDVKLTPEHVAALDKASDAGASVPGRHALGRPGVRVRRHDDQRPAVEGLVAGAAERQRAVLTLARRRAVSVAARRSPPRRRPARAGTERRRRQ